MEEASGCHLFETAFGTCGLAWSSRGLTRLQLPEADRAQAQERLEAVAPLVAQDAVPAAVVDAERRLCAYFAGGAADLMPIAIDLSATSAFFGLVYRLAREIPHGTTVTYGGLARRAGSPGASRAVGQAMARNPWPVIVPCHRVLAGGNKPGGFSAFGGLATKERLLALEGVDLAAPLPLFAGQLFSR